MSTPLASDPTRHHGWRSALAALLLVALSACGGGGDPAPTTPTPAPGSLSVALGSSGSSVVAGNSATTSVTITRGGSFSGAVTLVAEGAPAGVTATVSPSSVPAGSTAATLTLQVAGSATAGSYPITVRASGTGVSAATATYTLTVTAAPVADFTLALAPTAATVTAGGTVDVTVNLTRTGGFAGAVSLVTSTLPTGVIATFTPQSVTGTSAALQLRTSASTPAGTYPITVRGNATLLPERTVALTLTVQAPSGGTGNVTWRFCDTDRFPLWFAYQDGTGGAWTRVLPSANQTYSFTIASNRGGVVYVNRESSANADVVVFFTSREELQQLGQAECTTNPARKSLNGTVAGLGLGQTAQISVGGGSTTAAANGPFTVSEVNDGAVDLVAARNSVDLGTFSIIPDRLILRRALNLPNNGTIPTLDFGGTEAFAPATAAITAGNAGSDQVTMISSFASEAGGFTGSLFTAITGGATRTLYGVPLARTQAGDLHQVGVIATAGATSARGVYQYNREFTARTLTLGPALASPTVSSLGATPYPRLRAAGSFQVEYGQGIGVTYTQTTGGGRNWTVTATPAWFGDASTYQLDLPDLTSANGFDTGWALVAGATTTWSVSASRVENAPIGVFVENFRLMQASRSGTITP